MLTQPRTTAPQNPEDKADTQPPIPRTTTPQAAFGLFQQLCSRLPLEKIALIPLLLTDLSLASICTTLAVLLLRFMTPARQQESYFGAPARAILPAAEPAQL